MKLTLLSSKALQRITSALLAVALSASLIVIPVDALYADVKKSDIIYGQTVETRNLSVSSCPSIDASYACLMDSEGTIFFERSIDTPTKIASTTKIMTALVALELTESYPQIYSQQLTVSENAASIGESSAGLQAGDVIDFETALKAMMVPSGNDAAVTIAENLGKYCGTYNESKDATSANNDFVSKMNEVASQIGCSNSYFTNAHGLDDEEYTGDQHSTARDLALITKEAMTIDMFRNTVSLSDTTITVTRGGQPAEIELTATDVFPAYTEKAIGVKTGYTDNAGYCFSAAVKSAQGEYYAIVLNSSSSEQRFSDALALTDWVYTHNVEYSLIGTKEYVDAKLNGANTSLPVVAYVSHSDWTDKTVKATLSDPKASTQVFDLNGNVTQEVSYNEITGNVHVGDSLGTITFKQRDEVLEVYELIACEEVAGPNFFQRIGIWWHRLFNPDDKVAESKLINQLPLLDQKNA